MTTTTTRLRYSMDFVFAVDEVRNRIGHTLRDHAARKTLAEGRTIVTADDVAACVGPALREMLEPASAIKTPPQLTTQEIDEVLRREQGWYHLMELAIMGRIDIEAAVTAIERTKKPFFKRLWR